MEVSPVDGAVHHFGGQRRHESFGSAENVETEQGFEFRRSLHGGAVTQRTQAVEINAPPAITHGRAGYVEFWIK